MRTKFTGPCFRCKATTTYTNTKGYDIWPLDEDNEGHRICYKCWGKYFRSPKWNHITNPKFNPIWHPITNKRRICPRGGKPIYLKEDPKKGVCVVCGAIRGQDKCKITHMHHDKYTEDPLAHTRELCASCHGKLQKGVKRKRKVKDSSSQ